MMESVDALLRIQSAYPRIYLACHSRHQKSQRDGTLLAHLSEREPASQSDLGRHMGVAKSTLSEALFRTASRSAAMSSGSVLETERLRTVLEIMTAEERHRAVEGLELIDRAALRVSKGEDDV